MAFGQAARLRLATEKTTLLEEMMQVSVSPLYPRFRKIEGRDVLGR